MKIIKIGAIWCPGCLVMKKIWNEIVCEYPDTEIMELDYDMNMDEVKKYNPGNVLPVIIFMDGDNELGRLIGEQKKEKIIEKILEYR